MEPLLSIAMIWPTKSLGMKLANGKISVLMSCTTWNEEGTMLMWATKQNTADILRGTRGTSIYLYVNGFILLKFLDGQVIWGCAAKGNPPK